MGSRPFVISGLILLMYSAGVTWLSRFFEMGTIQNERPVLFFVVISLIAFGAYFFVVETMRKTDFKLPARLWLWILGIAVLSRLLLMFSHPIQETDSYRYLWDGHQVLQKANPYQKSPEMAFNSSSNLNGSNEIQNLYSFINYPQIRTIYPPLAQFIFAAAQMITPWKLWGWRLLIFTAELMMVGILVSTLRHMNRSPAWIVVYAWCPLILKEFSNSLHLDVFALLFLVGMIYFWVRSRHFAAVVMLAFAVLIKWFALILLPVIALWIYKRDRARIIPAVGLFFLILVSSFIPFWSALFEGLGQFGALWQVNDGIYNLIFHSYQSLGFDQFNAVNVLSRVTVFVLFSIIMILVLNRLRSSEALTDYLRACMILIAALFFLIPTGNPWYFTWVFPFLIFCPSRSLIFFSGLAFMYYIDFYFMYRTNFETWAEVVWVEYGLFFMLLGWELWKTRQLPSFCRFTTNAK